MSHISQALRIRAGGKGAVSTEPETSSLHQYDGEERVTGPREVPPALDDRSAASASARVDAHELRRDLAEAASGREGGPVAPFAPAARVAPIAPAKPTHLDAQARLVTGTSSTVSIEQYRRLAAALHEAQVEHQVKTVMITSALPDEGKTLTAVNLALTLSEAYARRVLVIDADLRAASMHRAFQVSNDRGLSEALRDDGELSFVQVSNGLAVLPAGTPGPTPLAGLTSGRMARILEECASRFDFVLIDTPPIGVLPDAGVLARLAGAVLFVVGAGSTPVAAVERAIAELGGPDAIFGLVLNRVEERRIPSASYYGHYKAGPR